MVADAAGRVMDVPDLAPAGRRGRNFERLNPEHLVPLPRGSQLYFLPERIQLAYSTGSRRPRPIEGCTAVAAFVPSGYVVESLAAYERLPQAPLLPLYTYAAVCWYNHTLCVPALRVESDVKHDPGQFSESRLKRLVRHLSGRHPQNRLLEHLGRNCALRYECANARNLFYGRWECPIPLSPTCNAACIGCISAQPDAPISAPQQRLSFVPRVQEILDLAVPHLESAERAMVSFGQGCEGEPLLQGELMIEIIRAIRGRTDRGTIHLNTNGSRPSLVDQLCKAGLDSIRVSLNSVQSKLYERYYRPRSYGWEHVRESIRIARDHGLFTSINYLTFPGLTDSPAEIDELIAFLEYTDLNMIQWRNLNIDPDAYLDLIDLPPGVRACGIRRLIGKLRRRFPQIRHGYVNPPRETWLTSDQTISR